MADQANSHTKENDERIAEIAALVGMQCAASSVQPVRFPDFQRAFLKECDRRDLSSDAAQGSASLRRILEHDNRVVWTDADSFWFFDFTKNEKSLAQAVERDAVANCEYSTRLLYRKERKLMRSSNVKTPEELYDILRCIYPDRAGKAVFGDHLSFGFGAIDRRRQVNRFVAKHPGKPKSVLAMEYEREYGFSAGVVETWIDLFADVDDVSLSDWIEREDSTDAKAETVTAEMGTTNAAPNDEAAFANVSDNEANRVRAVVAGAQEPAPAASQPSPTPKSERPSVSDFLARELTRDICDASLVLVRFKYEFPGHPDITKDSRALDKAGYYENQGLLFRKGSTPNEHFTRLIATHPSFSKGDSGFEEAVWKHQTFRYVLRKARENHQLFLYEPNSYISFTRLHDVLGIRLADIESYAPAVCMAVSPKTPFTIQSLQRDSGFVHELNNLDMPDAFYADLLDASNLLSSCTITGTKIFETDVERLSANSFIEWVVAHNEGVERESLPTLLFEEYGISCPLTSLNVIACNSNVYHDDVMDAYYSSIEKWKQEARNELA